MKLTPLDIQQQQFPRGLGGYKVKEVQVYLEFLGREYQALLSDTATAKDRAAELEAELLRYREREETLKEALVTAQKMSEDMRVAAKKEADLVLAEAEMKAERIIHHAHSRLISILEEISDLKRQRVQLAEALRGVLATHQKLLDSDERAANEQLPEDTVAYLKTKRDEAVPVPEVPAPRRAKE